MKSFSKKFLFLLTLYCFSCTSFANELPEQSINKNDPCTVFLCMAGKVKGENPSECSSPVGKFFSITSKKHGKFNGSRTSNARASFLGQCPDATKSMINKIISRYGALRH